MCGMLSVLAELQCELIVANTRDRPAAARVRGRKVGRPSKLTARRSSMPNASTRRANRRSLGSLADSAHAARVVGRKLSSSPRTPAPLRSGRTYAQHSLCFDSILARDRRFERHGIFVSGTDQFLRFGLGLVTELALRNPIATTDPVGPCDHGVPRAPPAQPLVSRRRL